MSAAKKMAETTENQPEGADREEIMREAAFERMVQRGLADSRNGRLISNEEMKRIIDAWLA